jgi:hypothetical protein
MDKLRAEGKIIFWCGCGRNAEIATDMPMRQMRCNRCSRYMIIMDKEDNPNG